VLANPYGKQEELREEIIAKYWYNTTANAGGTELRGGFTGSYQ